jgi:predicted transcriptional regulator
MTDLVVTASSVAKVSGSTKYGIASDAITAGQAVHKLASDGLVYLSDADHATVAKHAVDGIALNNAASGQPVAYLEDGVIAAGATVTVGEIYVLSGTAGGIAPEADLASGDFVSVIGVGISAANIRLGIINSGAEVP